MSRFTRMASTNSQEEAIQTLEETLKRINKKLVGGVTCGKSPQTVVLDLTYQGSEIRVNAEGDVTLHDKSIEPYSEDDVLSVLENYKKALEASDG